MNWIKEFNERFTEVQFYAEEINWKKGKTPMRAARDGWKFNATPERVKNFIKQLIKNYER